MNALSPMRDPYEGVLTFDGTFSGGVNFEAIRNKLRFYLIDTIIIINTSIITRRCRTFRL